MALFFDFSNMPQADQLRAKDAAVDFITKQMTASDLVSIMAYGNRFDVLEDFTADRDRLLSRLQKMATGEGAGLADVAATSADEGDDSGGFVADDTEFNIFNTDRKLTALEDATKKLAAYPEKKALIYFASGLTLTGLENQSQLRATVNSAVRANVSFYPVDARGLAASSPVGDASTSSGRGTGAFTGSKQSGQRNSVTGSQDTLYTLASDTGGKALVDSNDLAMGIRQAQEDISSYYILGYYSTNAAEDGKYRKIQVKLAGKELQSNAKVDYRNGYYAGKVFAKFTAGDKERQLEEALTLGDPVSELPLALEVDYFRVAQNRYLVPISVKIPGSVLALAKKGGKQSTDFDFIGQVREQPSGKLVGGVRDNIPVKLSDADASQLEHRHLQYDAGLTLPPGQIQPAIPGAGKSDRQNGHVRNQLRGPGLVRVQGPALEFRDSQQPEGRRQGGCRIGRQRQACAGESSADPERPEDSAQYHAGVPQRPDVVCVLRSLRSGSRWRFQGS